MAALDHVTITPSAYTSSRCRSHISALDVAFLSCINCSLRGIRGQSSSNVVAVYGGRRTMSPPRVYATTDDSIIGCVRRRAAGYKRRRAAGRPTRAAWNAGQMPAGDVVNSRRRSRRRHVTGENNTRTISLCSTRSSSA